MLRIFIINLLLVLLFNTNGYGQSSLNDSLLRYEYAYFNCKNDSLRQELLIRKVNLYLQQNITGNEVVNEIKRIEVGKIANTTIKQDFLWNAALVSYLNNESDRLRFYLSQYNTISGDTSMAYNLLLILANKYKDTALVNTKIKELSKKDSLFTGLSCFANIITYNRKHLNFYLLSSLIVPGSGAIMNGYIFKGLVSLALAAGSVYGIITLIHYELYINAVLWGTGVGLKFYFGNVKLTENLFYKREVQQKNKLTENCELILQKLLQKYPLTLKN